MKLLFLLLTIIPIVYPWICSPSGYQLWQQKCYQNSQGDYQTWEKSCIQFNKHKQRSQSFKLDFCKNQFADHKPTIQRLKLHQNTQIQLNDQSEKKISTQIPKVGGRYYGIDWRDSARITPIRNQGSCGCCWAFVSSAMIESHLSIHNGTNYHVSQQHLLECTSNSTCSGGYINLAITQVIARNGIPTSQKYPYLAASYSAGTNYNTVGICNSNITYSNTKYFLNFSKNMQFNQYRDVNVSFIRKLLNDGPVGALIVADSGFMSYSGGVYSCGQNKTMDQLNHAVLIIGMDNNSNYIIKNSYGSNWGDHGFGMINSSYNDCGIRIAVYQLTYGSIVEIFWIMSILIVVMLF